MIDTHTHLYLRQFENGGRDAVNRALQAGVSHFILPNVDEETITPMKNLHKEFPECTSMSIGLHPTDIKDNWGNFLMKIEDEAESGEFIAIGEVGIDLYWDKTNLELQKEVFSKQIKIAESNQLPVIIHCRDAFEETIEVIDSLNPGIPLIFHSFTGGIKDVRKIRRVCEPYFGINGVVTYKNAPELREALTEIGIEHIVLETDSPYLTPVPFRGKRNESSYLPLILEKVSECLGLSTAETNMITDRNVRMIFGI